ncbi:MAG TPA: hypothetical protein VGF45_10980, partial [Polyangia bacterium]
MKLRRPPADASSMGDARPAQGGTDSRWRMPLGGATLVAFAAALIAIEVVPVRPGAASLAEQAAALATRLEREATAAIA